MSGAYAVDFFFILSGFIMAYVYKEKLVKNFNKQEIFNFYIKRFARIYPLHIFTLLLLLLTASLELWVPNRPVFEPKVLFLNFSLMNVWFHPSINMPAWSISAEFISYLFFPVIVFLLRKQKKNSHNIIIIFLLCLLYSSLIDIFGFKSWHYGIIATARATIGFIIGFLLHDIFKNSDSKDSKRFDPDYICLSLLVVYFLLLHLGFPTLFTYVFIPPIIFFLASSKTIAHFIFSNKISLYLGKISFSIYLIHCPILEYYKAFYSHKYMQLNPETDQLYIWGHLLLIIITVLVVAALCYHLVEYPSRRALIRTFIKSDSLQKTSRD